MNLQEIRKKYPQYANISDELMARGLHKKYYSSMDFNDFSQKIGYQPPVEKPAFSLKPLTAEEKDKAVVLAKAQRPKGNGAWGIAKEGVKGFGQGLVSGAESALNGYMLGGYRWAGDKLGLGVSNRAEALQKNADAAGTGGLNRIGQVVAELGGGLRGAGKMTYDLATKGISGLGTALKSGKLAESALAPAILSGGVDAGIYSAFNNNFSNPKAIWDDARHGMYWAGGLGTVGKALLPISKLFSSKSMTKGMRGGLENVADNPEAVKILNSGIRQSDDIAQEYLNKVPVASRQINADVSDMLNNSLTRRIDVPLTIAGQKKKYGQFMQEHAGDSVIDFAPRQQISSIMAESGYNPSLGRSKGEYERMIKDRAAEAKVELSDDMEHFLRPQRKEYVRTLKNTLEKPDVKYTQINPANFRQDYFAKKYINNRTGEPFFDLAFTRDGRVFNKFNTDENYIANQFKKPIQDLSLNGYVSGNRADKLHPDIINNITQNGAVVNPQLPNVSTLYEGLTPYQSQKLDLAIQKGLLKTNQKAGSLESVNKIKQELNDLIETSVHKDPNNPMKMKADSGVGDLIEIKKRVDNVLGTALKGRDRGYHKAKQMEKAFDAGMHYNPNNMATVDLVPELKSLERNSFAQGLFRRITNNPLTGWNLAKDALKYDNTLAGIFPGNRYNSLVGALNRQSTKFGRLAKLGNLADTKLQTPEANRLFLREQAETPGAAKGAMFDWLNSALRGRAIWEASYNLMNPKFVGTSDNWLMENYPYLANSIATMMPQARNR